MNYYIDLTGNMNIRQTPDPNGVLIATLAKGTRVEGDELFKDAANRDWLKVLLIGAVQTTQPTFIATYTTSGVLKTNPVVPDPLPFQVGLNIIADSPLQLSRVNEDGTRTLLFSADVGEYVIAFTANDSNRPFIRME
jgi:hypothetical protein